MLRSELRYAIWIAHGKRDAYGGDLIEHFGDLEIDHIIPKSTNKELLNEKVLKYNLSSDFTLDSIENLLPTSKLRNRQKSGVSFNESSERFYLAYAQEKKKLIEEECTKAIKNRKIKEKIQFGKSYNIVDTDQPEFNPTYFHSDTLLVLNALLPSKFNEFGSCAIEFYEVGNMITLTHDLIMHLIDQCQKHTLKEEILQYYNEKSETAFVIIGTSSLHIKKDAYNQLIIILGDFLTVYKEFSCRFKMFMGIENFEMYKSKERYKLTEITLAEWNYLISYAYQNDIDNSKRNSFCFNANPNILIALTPLESIVKFTVSPLLRIDKVTLVWHLPKKNDHKFIEGGHVWTATKTLKWIEEVLGNIKNNGVLKEAEPTTRYYTKSILHGIKKIFFK